MNRELDFLLRITNEAKEISKETFNVEAKGDDYDLITTLDTKIEKFLIQKIKEEYPNFDIVSEEYNYSKEVSDNCFIIDPIDGTINFAMGIPLWAIQICCYVNGKPVASVISFPKLNETYYADENYSYLNGNKIHVKDFPISKALYSIDGMGSAFATCKMRKHTSNRRNLGALCIALCYVASGVIHGAVFRDDKPWDYAPGLHLIKNAGGVICDEKGFHAGAMNQEFLDLLKRETKRKITNSNLFILHSLNADTTKVWGKEMKHLYESKDVYTFMPSFPIRENSSYEAFKEKLLEYIENGKLNNDSIVVCHSVSNPYFIRFARECNYTPKAYIAIAPTLIYEYPIRRKDYFPVVAKKAYLKEEDFKYASHLNNVYCLYSDEDDKNIEKFKRFVKDFNAMDYYLEGYNHFDGYHKIYKIPELETIIDSLLDE